MECKNCGHKCMDEDNFCEECGTKLKETCNCWVRKTDNYNCGKNSCPGNRLLLLEISKSN